MGWAQPMGVVIIVIPGALEGFLEEVTLNWALEVSRTVCGADTGQRCPVGDGASATRRMRLVMTKRQVLSQAQWEL